MNPSKNRTNDDVDGGRMQPPEQVAQVCGFQLAVVRLTCVTHLLIVCVYVCEARDHNDCKITVLHRIQALSLSCMKEITCCMKIN